MEQTHHLCLFPKCGGQMHQLTGQYQSLRWFCDSCWFTLPNSFFSAEKTEEPRYDNFLAQRIAQHRKQLIDARRKEIDNALEALRKKTLVDDEPEIACVLEPAKSLRA